MKDTLYLLINEPIYIHKHKVDKLYQYIYSEQELPLTINKKDIFIINDDDDHTNNINENGKINISNEKIKNKKDQKYIQELIHKLIINIKNGKDISSINKLVEDIIESSYLEKNTKDTEIFYKYSKDKDIMYEKLKKIFTKKSDYINIIEDEKLPIYKRIKTNKLKNTPFYINKLFGYHSSLVFKIDNKNSDWYNIIEAFKSINISFRFVKTNLTIPQLEKIGDIQKLII